MLRSLFDFQINAFDYLHKRWESESTNKAISNIVIVFFTLGLLVVLLTYLGFHIFDKPVSAFFAIELAFNALLVFEVIGLIFLIPYSVADSVGKQFEIISLLLLRDAFKEFGHNLDDFHWDTAFIQEFAPIVSDAFGAILLFLITGLFYRSQRHAKITRSYEEQQRFIKIKKLISVYLTISFIGLGIYEIIGAYQLNQAVNSLKLFYNLLIFSDIFILLFSLRYSTKYLNLFRYSSFALATVFLRLTLSAPAYFNVILAITVGLMVLLVTYIYNKMLEKNDLM
jgi:hypothetical protein